jgi:hypothetical protein
MYTYFSALTLSGWLLLGHYFIALEFIGRQLGSRTIEIAPDDISLH